MLKKIGLLEKRFAFVSPFSHPDAASRLLLRGYKEMRILNGSLAIADADISEIDAKSLLCDIENSEAWTFFPKIAGCCAAINCDCERVFSIVGRLFTRLRRRLHVYLPALIYLSHRMIYMSRKVFQKPLIRSPASVKRKRSYSRIPVIERPNRIPCKHNDSPKGVPRFFTMETL